MSEKIGTELLTVRERLAIRRRNPDNPDVARLLAENDALRRLLWPESEEVKKLQRLLDTIEECD